MPDDALQNGVESRKKAAPDVATTLIGFRGTGHQGLAGAGAFPQHRQRGIQPVQQLFV